MPGPSSSSSNQKGPMNWSFDYIRPNISNGINKQTKRHIDMDNHGTFNVDGFIHADDSTVDHYLPIKRLRIDSTPLPDFPNLSLHNSSQQPLSNENKTVEERDYQMCSPMVNNHGIRDNVAMETTFSSSNYHGINNFLGSLHAERRKRLFQDDSSAKLTLEEKPSVSTLQSSSYHQMSSSYPTEFHNHSSDHQLCDTSSSQQEFHQLTHSDSGKAINQKRQTRLKWDSQLY